MYARPLKISTGSMGSITASLWPDYRARCIFVSCLVMAGPTVEALEAGESGTGKHLDRHLQTLASMHNTGSAISQDATYVLGVLFVLPLMGLPASASSFSRICSTTAPNLLCIHYLHLKYAWMISTLRG